MTDKKRLVRAVALGILAVGFPLVGNAYVEPNSFWDRGKIYTIFGFSFCFPVCPYISVSKPYRPRIDVMEPRLH